MSGDQTITIRPVTEEDAEAYLALAHQLDRETSFMMLEPGERTTDVEEQRRRLRAALASDNSMTFVAETEEGQLVGLLGAMGGGHRRNRETLHIFIGVLQAFSGQGVGRRLFEAMEAWARGCGAHRLELTVMCHNRRAVALYHRMGFYIEGVRRDSLKVGGAYVDEYAMCKILEPHP